MNDEMKAWVQGYCFGVKGVRGIASNPPFVEGYNLGLVDGRNMVMEAIMSEEERKELIEKAYSKGSEK